MWLEITPLARLEYQHIDAVPDLIKGTADISLKIVGSNSGNTAQNVTLEVNIKRNNKIVAEGKIQTTLAPNTSKQEMTWRHTLPKSKVDLWHYDFPHLYEATVRMSDETNTELHTISDRFGIRKLEVKGLEILLNGERIRPVGFNIVPEDRFTGNTLPFERIKEDVDLMKSLGANMARLSHVSLPKEYLDYLDEKGMMIFEEVGLWGKDIWVDPDHPMPKEWLQRMVEEKYNHASVVGWSVGNEIGDEQKNPKVKDYVKGAIQMAKNLDPHRLAVYASNTAQKFPNDAIVYADLAMINVYGGWGQAADRTWNYHQKPIFISEFGHTLNDEDPNLGEIPIEKMMNSLRNKAYVLGASIWTFNDYRSTYYGQTGWITPPSQNRPWGIVTTFRDKKRAFYSLQKAYAPVKRLEFSNINTSKSSVTVTIEPRGKLDIPANVLRGYSLRWTILDKAFDTIAVQYIPLKTIYPGDHSFSLQMPWNSKADARLLNLELIDPQGYSVLQERKHLAVPNQPTIRFANTAQNAVRIYVEPSIDAAEYMVRYQKEDSVYTSGSTINAFMDIEDERVKQGETWRYQLIAINDAGESMPSEAVELKKDEDELPPMVWGHKRVADDIYIAYSVSPYDYLYEVEYGAQPGVYSDRLTTKLKGVLHLQSVVKGEPLYFRMRVRKQWGFASEWTQAYMVPAK